MTYTATISHPSLRRAREITITGTLLAAKAAATREFGGGYNDHHIVITDEGGETVTLVNINGWHGDSGAGVFNAEGMLIGVNTGRVSQGEPSDEIMFGYFYPLRFSKEQLDAAVGYGAK